MIDSLQLTARHKVATPVNWKQGEDVIISGSVSNDEARELFGDWEAPRALHPDRAPTPGARTGGVTQRDGSIHDMGCEDPMILKQYYLGCLAHASYLIADQASGQAAVVDPQRDVKQYLEDTARLGSRIEHVFLTHFHADFVAGHLELRDRTGARIYLGARALAVVRDDSRPRPPRRADRRARPRGRGGNQLGRIGFDNVAGYLAGGVQPLGTAPELIERTARVTAPTLAELMAPAPGPLLIDVRTEREWRAGRIDGAVNIPLTRLAQDMARLQGMAGRRVLRERLPLGDRRQPHPPRRPAGSN